MRLKADWRFVLKRAWSMRFAALAGCFSAAEAVLPFFATDLPRGVFAGLALLSSVGAFITRLLAQKGFD
jgi:hypothetical protein